MTKVYTNDASGNLFNTLIAEQDGIKNDAALAKTLGVAPPVVSKIRAGRLPVGATLILRIHETFGYSVKAIRALIAADATPAAA